MILGLLDGFDDVLIQPLLPDYSVVAFETGVLLRLAGLDVQDGNPLFPSPLQQLATDGFRAIVDPMMSGLPRRPMIRLMLRITRSEGSERSTSMPSPSPLKSSCTFSSRNARPSPNRSAMKSIDQVVLRATGTASASGLSRFSRFRGLIRRFSSGSQ